MKAARVEITSVTERVLFLRTKDGVLLEKETGRRRTGLWKLPALPPSHHDAPPPVLMKSHYGITRYKVTLWVHEPPSNHSGWPENCQIVAHEDLASTPMPSPYRRALNALLKSREGELL